MKTLVINAHPTPSTSHTQSFFKETLFGIETVDYIELVHTSVTFNDLLAYKRIIFQFPVYWYSSPALLKSWIDDTLVSHDERLKGIELGIVPIFGTSKAQYQAGGSQHYTPSEMLRPFEMIANHLGMTYLTPFSVFQFEYLCEKQRKQLLMAYWLYVCGPKNPTFKEKGEFLVSCLKRYETSQHIIDLITDNQYEIDNLTMVLGELQ